VIAQARSSRAVRSGCGGNLLVYSRYSREQQALNKR
jgi:hypothetical protein